MGKIGFKMSHELKAEKKRTRKVEPQEEVPVIIPGTATAHTLDVMVRIQEFEEYIMSSSFTRLSKVKKRETLESYRFLLTTLALIQPPSSGINEVAVMSSMGFVG